MGGGDSPGAGQHASMGRVVGYVWDGWAGMDGQAAGKEEVGVFRGRACEATSGQCIRCLPLPVLPNLLLGHLCLPPAKHGRCQPRACGGGQGHLRYKDESSEDRIQPFLLPCQAEESCRGCAVPSCLPLGWSVGLGWLSRGAKNHLRRHRRACREVQACFPAIKANKASSPSESALTCGILFSSCCFPGEVFHPSCAERRAPSGMPAPAAGSALPVFKPAFRFSACL